MEQRLIWSLTVAKKCEEAAKNTLLVTCLNSPAKISGNVRQLVPVRVPLRAGRVAQLLARPGDLELGLRLLLLEELLYRVRHLVGIPQLIRKYPNVVT